MKKWKSFNHIYVPEEENMGLGTMQAGWVYTGVGGIIGGNQLNKSFPKSGK